MSDPIHIFTKVGLRNLCLATGPHYRMNLSGNMEQVFSHAYPRAFGLAPSTDYPGRYAAIVYGTEPTANRWDPSLREGVFCPKCFLVFTAMQANSEESPREARRILRRGVR